MFKKIIAWTLLITLTATAAIGGTVAYLTSEDSDVNVMTLGNVSIDQTENFEQFSDLYPGVSVTKEVTVTNDGSWPAYVRTIVAVEIGDMDGSYLKIDWAETPTEIGVAEFNNSKYKLYVVYNNVLTAGESYTALNSVGLTAEADNAQIEALDGNNNGKFEVLVVSQAIQTEGFTDAAVALNTGYGAVDAAYAAELFGDMQAPVSASNAQELKDAMLTRGANIVLTEDIIVDKDTPLQWGAYMFVANGREVTINLNGKKIIVDEDASLQTKAVFTTANGGTLNIEGEGTVEITNAKSGIFHAMNKNDQINVYGGTYISNSDNGNNSLAIIYTNSGNVDVYGGKFCSKEGVECANAEDTQGSRLSVVFHEGALLKHSKYYAGSDATRIQLEEGCELQEVTINGETWYQVVKK